MGGGIWEKNKIIFSHGKSNARGVAIGFCGNFDYDLKKSEIDTDGRFVIVEASVKKETYIFTSRAESPERYCNHEGGRRLYVCMSVHFYMSCIFSKNI